MEDKVNVLIVGTSTHKNTSINTMESAKQLAIIATITAMLSKWSHIAL
jgi:hypothetical protein